LIEARNAYPRFAKRSPQGTRDFEGLLTIAAFVIIAPCNVDVALIAIAHRSNSIAVYVAALGE
jgi:hypothetical protein